MWKKRFRCLAVLGGLTGATLLAVPQAQAAPTMSVVSTAPLEAGGAGIAVRVDVTCTRGLESSVDVQVRQRQGAAGPITDYFAASTSFVCSGGVQSIPIGVPSDGTKLHVGSAFVRAGLTSCSLDGCAPRVVATRTVTVVSAAPVIRRTVSAGTISPGSQGITVTLAKQIVQRAGGAAATLAVFYRCTTWPDLSARMQQLTPDGAVTVLSDALPLTCDGTNQVARFVFQPSAPLPLRPAFVVVEASRCEFFCGLPRLQAFTVAPVVTG